MKTSCGFIVQVGPKSYLTHRLMGNLPFLDIPHWFSSFLKSCVANLVVKFFDLRGYTLELHHWRSNPRGAVVSRGKEFHDYCTIAGTNLCLKKESTCWTAWDFNSNWIPFFLLIYFLHFSLFLIILKYY